MARMNDTVRQRIIALGKLQGFQVQLKLDGSDLYEKYLVFRSSLYLSDVFISRRTGFNGAGDPSYLKVAVHPDRFLANLVKSDAGIHDYINLRTKINRHSSSNYVGFPCFDGNHEPCGKCYKADGLDSLEKLFAGLHV